MLSICRTGPHFWLGLFTFPQAGTEQELTFTQVSFEVIANECLFKKNTFKAKTTIRSLKKKGGNKTLIEFEA